MIQEKILMDQVEVKYAPGMRIIVRGEEWLVKKVETNSLGNQTLHVIGLSQLVKDYESMFLVDVEDDIEIVDPAKVTLVPDNSAFFRKSKVYIESQWRGKIPTDNKIHIGNKAAMDLMSYQLEPAQMALNKTRQRILIADTVGLGKTLEAGILMSELIARGKGKRILVVTVKSMMTQFQKEMWNRFTIPLVRLDSSRIQSVRAKLPTNYNPFFYYDKTIISVDTLKNDLDYRTHLENAWWDIIVIDEAHNVAKRGDRSSQRSKLASLLANRSDTLIMLTATPHDGKGQSVASLMNMLDPTAIADEENYTKDDIEGLLIRRFKKDIQDQVSGAFKERVITIERCAASAREEAAYDIFADMKLQMDESRTRGKGILFKTSLEKSLFSSPAACIKSIDARIRKLEKKYPDGDMPDIVTLKELKAALELISPADFSRYAKLLKLLNSTEYGWSPSKNNDRLVIFTERIETMKYLAENLKKDLGLKDNQLEVMHGGMSDKELQRIVDEFGRAESPIRVIVASDVASEGINLHYLSHRLIHFDIPWSLMVFQQRNGRVDRYGQTEQPDIRYMLIDSDNPRIKGDARIMEILVKKEEQALKNIGDPAMLFGKFNQEEEETAKVIESGAGAAAFEKLLDSDEEEFDPLELLMGLGDEKEVKVEYSDEETLFSDIDYMTYYGYPENLEEYKKAIEQPSMYDAFTIEALKAHIFDPKYTKLITKARLRNCAMLQIVDLMSISRPSSAKERRGRISYSDLGINQMGAVYEALLSYRGFIAEEDLYEVKRAGDKFNELDVGYFVKENELVNYDEKTERVRYESGEKKGQLRMYEKGTFIYRLAGREREKSASYYTPEVLTKCLVKYALKELLKDKTADEILHLTVCEPAMGSAAFLNEAINQLAEAYLTKKQEELGETISYDKRFEELQKVKMFIADRNVYGCDLNPVAVELAEVSLWLNTIYKGAYVPWFGTQLVNGNSLIGARRQVYSQAALESGKWYEKAPRRIMPNEARTRDRQQKRTKEVYHFLLGDPGMANYSDKVIKSLEPDKIKYIKEWNKKFTSKFDEDDIETVLRLSDIIDDLWKRTVELRKKVEELLTIAACLNSVVFDFYIKTFGKEDLYENTLGNLPLFDGKLIKYLWSRVLLLNAIGNEYDELVEYILPNIDVNDSWARNNERLPKMSFFEILSDKHFVASDYARRELLLEIDVLVSIMLGISIADLQNIYRLQFPVMKQYEEDTWYDIDGKIVYTCNKNIPSLSRKEWEDKMEQSQIITIIECNSENGIKEKEIMFKAPFICANRLSDYEEAWENFTRL